MMKRAKVQVSVRSPDPLTLAGLVNTLGVQPGVVVLQDESWRDADVVVAAFDRLDPEAVATLQAAAEEPMPIVVLQDQADAVGLLAPLGHRVVALLPRAAAADERLMQAVHTAADLKNASPNALRCLLTHTQKRQEVPPAAVADAASLSPREIAILRLVADGLDTSEIARRLGYSERTVKNIIYLLTNRLNLHNRSHAVAYAMRAGII